MKGERFEIEKIPSQKGRIAIITGANIGLGYEVALALAKKDFKVILACRNSQKAEKAKNQILLQVPNADIEIMQVDLSRLNSVRLFAKTYSERYKSLDILVNNAGIMCPPFSLTEDGFESQMAANYFGHFLLTGLLMQTIINTPNSRIVSVSSHAHRMGKINFEDLNAKYTFFKLKAYNQSKLACLLFAYELQRKLENIGASTISVAAHPGGSDTNLFKHYPDWFVNFLRPILLRTVVQTPKAGSEPLLYAALGENVKGGEYFGPSGFFEMRGRATKVESSSMSKNEHIAQKLWTVSKKLTKIKDDNDPL